MKKVFWTILLGLVQVCVSNGQSFKLEGLVIDSASKEPLAFSLISIEGHAKIIADEKGKFTTDILKAGIHGIEVSHVGCDKKILYFNIRKDTTIVIYLAHHEHIFEAVTVHGHSDDENQFTDHHTDLKGKSLELYQHKTLGEILTQINGVQTLKTGQSISKPMIRGMQGNRVMILTNGLRLESQQWGDEHGPELDPRSGDNITVLKGAGTLRYGYDAIGGIILFESLAFHDSGFVGKTGFTLTDNGKMGGTFLRLALSKRNFKWAVLGNSKKSGDQQTPAYNLSNTAYEESSLSTRLAFNRKNSYFETYASWYNNKIGILKASHIGNLTDLEKALKADTPLFVQPFSYEIGKPHQVVSHALFQEKYLWKKDKNRFEAQYGFQYNRRQEYDNRRGSDKNKPQLFFELFTHSAEMVGEHHRKQQRHLAGIQSTYQLNKQEGFFLIPNYLKLQNGAFYVFRMEKKRMLFEFGGRYDLQQLTTYIYDEKGTIMSSRKFNGLSLNLNGQYQLNHDWLWFWQAGSNWRAPSVNELYSNGLHHGAAAIELGDQMLDKERALGFSTNLSYNHNRFSAEWEPYFKYIKDFISLQPRLPPALTVRGAFPVFKFESRDVYFSGLDMQWNWAPVSKNLIKGQYSLIYVKTAHDNQYLNGMPPIRMDHQWRLNVPKWKAFSANFFSLGWQHVFKQYWANAARDYAPPPKGYDVFRLTVNGQINAKKKSHHISLSVDNILNNKYRDYLNRFRYYADETGRSVTLNYHLTF